MSKEYLCSSPEMTFAAGQHLAGVLENGDVLGLIGDLGAGKTLLVQGMACGLGVPDSVRVTSPSFSLVNEYSGGRLSIVHIDLYRIEKRQELDHLGLEEMIDCAGVSAVEWCERYPVLPADHLRITISGDGVVARRIRAEGTGARSIALVLAWNCELERANFPRCQLT